MFLLKKGLYPYKSKKKRPYPKKIFGAKNAIFHCSASVREDKTAALAVSRGLSGGAFTGEPGRLMSLFNT
jgi:hypothetical protein